MKCINELKKAFKKHKLGKFKLNINRSENTVEIEFDRKHSKL